MSDFFLFYKLKINKSLKLHAKKRFFSSHIISSDLNQIFKKSTYVHVYKGEANDMHQIDIKSYVLYKLTTPWQKQKFIKHIIEKYRLSEQHEPRQKLE